MRRSRSIVIVSLLILICFVLQSTLFRTLTFGGIGPNLMIALTVSLSLVFGDRKGLFIGFVCGLLCDIFFSSLLGFNALVYALVGYLFGKFERMIYPDDMKVPLLTIMGGDLLYGFLSYVFLFLIRGKMYFSYFMIHYVFPEMLYTLLLAIPMYPLVLSLYQRYMREIRESEKSYAQRDAQQITGKADVKS
ncbi:MAG: rod shape-determining protein MreD [Lachnospiraceae bacterium]|jgi:rod shape-determining protein MreD|nr:rod shape-determining protein MreD [Lachnospiraceae bacterium]